MEELQRHGHETVPFDLRRQGCETIEDICDREAVARALTGVDGIIHLAAISRVAWGERRPGLCNHVNVEGTRNLLAAAAKLPGPPWFLFASSREVYGDTTRTPVSEDDPVAPLNVYGRSKAAGEDLVLAARDLMLNTAIVRLSSVYGTTNDHHDRVIPALLWKALVGEDLELTGSASYFDFVHVDDTVRGLLPVVDMLGASERNLPPVHLATGVATSLGQLAKTVVATAGTACSVRELPRRPFDVGGFVGSTARARSLLGWSAKIGIEEGVARLAADMRRRGSPLPVATIPDPQWIARPQAIALQA